MELLLKSSVKTNNIHIVVKQKSNHLLCVQSSPDQLQQNLSERQRGFFRDPRDYDNYAGSR